MEPFWGFPGKRGFPSAKPPWVGSSSVGYARRISRGISWRHSPGGGFPGGRISRRSHFPRGHSRGMAAGEFPEDFPGKSRWPPMKFADAFPGKSRPPIYISLGISREMAGNSPWDTGRPDRIWSVRRILGNGATFRAYRCTIRSNNEISLE